MPRFSACFPVACLLVLALTACARQPAETIAPMPKPSTHYFDISVGDKRVRMQLAVTEIEQQRGLMHRRDLGANDGMVFVYPRPQPVSFWMRNTPTPLDIGFFDATGVLREVYPMEPFDETPVQSRSPEIQFPLEMKQGWFNENGVKPGAKLDLAALSSALKARGFDPRKFGLE